MTSAGYPATLFPFLPKIPQNLGASQYHLKAMPPITCFSHVSACLNSHHPCRARQEGIWATSGAGEPMGSDNPQEELYSTSRRIMRMTKGATDIMATDITDGGLLKLVRTALDQTYYPAESASPGHPLPTDTCPSIARMMKAVSTDSWTTEEREHMKDCAFCLKFIPRAKAVIL